MTTVDLVHRGKSTIDHIELFDECEFGADRLHYRGRFGTIWEVAYQIAFALNDEEAKNKITTVHADQIKKAFYQDFDGELLQYTPADFGCGNPMEEGATKGIALNRYDVPEKNYNTVKSELYPRHADYFVQFMIRPKFWADHGYITLGIKWNDAKIDWYKNFGIKVEDLEVVKTLLISIADANLILSEIKQECSTNLPEGLIRVPSVFFPKGVYAKSSQLVREESTTTDTMRPLYSVELLVEDIKQPLAGTGSLLYPYLDTTYNKNTSLYIDEAGMLYGAVGNIWTRSNHTYEKINPLGKHIWEIGNKMTSIGIMSSLWFDGKNIISKNAGGTALARGNTYNWYICAYEDYYVDIKVKRNVPIMRAMEARFYGGKVITQVKQSDNSYVPTLTCNWVPCYDKNNDRYVIYDTVKQETLQILAADGYEGEIKLLP